MVYKLNVTGHNRFTKAIYEENGRKAENMCDVLDAVEQRGKAEGKAEGRAEGRVEGRTEAVTKIVNIEHLSIARSIFHIAYWCVIKVLKIK